MASGHATRRSENTQSGIARLTGGSVTDGIGRVVDVSAIASAARSSERVQELLVRVERRQLFSQGVAPSTPHHCVVNDPGNDSKNSSSM
jgi:hypothetical protein